MHDIAVSRCAMASGEFLCHQTWQPHSRRWSAVAVGRCISAKARCVRLQAASVVPCLMYTLWRMESLSQISHLQEGGLKAAKHQQATMKAAVCCKAACAVPCPLQALQCNTLLLER